MSYSHSKYPTTSLYHIHCIDCRVGEYHSSKSHLTSSINHQFIISFILFAISSLVLSLSLRIPIIKIGCSTFCSLKVSVFVFPDL